MTPRKVLVFRTSNDPEVYRVADALKARGGELITLDTDDFPTACQAWLRCDSTSEEVVFQSPSGRIAFADLSALWLRHLDVGARLPKTMEDRYRVLARQESQAMLLGLAALFKGRVVDPYPDMRRAADKLRQLQVARELGLEIPRTLVTNVPEAVRRFADDCSGQLVAKALSALRVAVADEDQFVYTNAIRQEDLQDLDGLKLCPMVFQERLSKRLEIRATVVGERVFAAAVDSQASERGRVDWRREGVELNEYWQTYRLPTEIVERLVALVDGFGLTYSAADLVLTPDGRFVFLESNPAGEWFWLDRLLNLGIAESLAEELMSETEGRSR